MERLELSLLGIFRAQTGSDKMIRTNGEQVRNDMRLEVKVRPFSGAVARAASIAVLAFVVTALVAAPAAAQTGEPIKIGYRPPPT
jgi:hypothetical protein